MDRRTLLGAFGGLAGASLLPRIARAQTADADWRKVEDAARKEGAATLYHTFAPTGMQALIAAFNKQYPEIKVTQFRIASQPFYQRFTTEYNAGKNYADVCANSMDDIIRQWDAKGWIAHWTPPSADGIPKALTLDNAIWAVQLVRQIIAYNTQLVTPAQAPKDWPDLLDPKWKGKVGISPPWLAIGPLQAINYIEKTYHIANSAERFKALDVRIFEGAPAVTQALIRGDIDLAQVADLSLNETLADGAPIGLVYPKSGVTFTEIALFVPNKSPNPNAGKVLGNWLLSKDGQIALQEYTGSAGSRNDIPGPSHLPANRDLKLVDGFAITSVDDQNRIVAQWRKAFNVT